MTMEQAIQANVEKLLQVAAVNEAEHADFNRRLGELDNRTKKQTEILITLERQNNTLERMGSTLTEVKKSVDDVSSRVKALEIEPASKWKKMTWEILKWAVLAVAGFTAGVAFKGL